MTVHIHSNFGTTRTTSDKEVDSVSMMTAQPSVGATPVPVTA